MVLDNKLVTQLSDLEDKLAQWPEKKRLLLTVLADVLILQTRDNGKLLGGSLNKKIIFKQLG